MEGYTIMAKELREEFEQLNDWPTHIPAGVEACSSNGEIRKSWKFSPKFLLLNRMRHLSERKRRVW